MALLELTILPKAEKALKGMMEHIRTTYQKEPVAVIDLNDIPDSDEQQCIVSFMYRENLPDPCIANVQGIDILIDDEYIDTLSGKTLDYNDGAYILA